MQNTIIYHAGSDKATEIKRLCSKGRIFLKMEKFGGGNFTVVSLLEVILCSFLGYSWLRILTLIPGLGLVW